MPARPGVRHLTSAARQAAEPGRRAGRVLAAVLLAGLIPAAAAARERSPTEVLARPGWFDGKRLVIAGTVANLEERTSAGGRPYYLFELDDGLRAIGVITFGRRPCQAGAYAVIEGEFARLRRHDQQTFRNQVRAWRVTCSEVPATAPAGSPAPVEAGTR